ncbi:hypothetical protein PG5_10950 [Pseudomonas sp. G5(2012)]|nr:hypothetical protein PG5_10950 [Pseudomonas sp. G5(2012)]
MIPLWGRPLPQKPTPTRGKGGGRINRAVSGPFSCGPQQA